MQENGTDEHSLLEGTLTDGLPQRQMCEKINSRSARQTWNAGNVTVIEAAPSGGQGRAC